MRRDFHRGFPALYGRGRLKLHQIGVEVKLFGGYEHAERQMAAFFPGGLGFSWDYRCV